MPICASLCSTLWQRAPTSSVNVCSNDHGAEAAGVADRKVNRRSCCGCRWYEGDAEGEEDVFKPASGNVLFASALDGWAFTLPRFAQLYAKRFGFSPAALARAMWGPYTFRAKERKILHTNKAGAKAKPIFVSFVLAPLWAAYEALEPWADAGAILGKIATSQGLSVPANTLVAGGKAALQVRCIAQAHGSSVRS